MRNYVSYLNTTVTVVFHFSDDFETVVTKEELETGIYLKTGIYAHMYAYIRESTKIRTFMKVLIHFVASFRYKSVFFGFTQFFIYFKVF